MLVAQLLVAQLALLVILVISHSQATEPPGVKLSLSQKGLDYIDQVAVEILTKKIKTLSLPEVSGDADTPVGHISYHLKNMVTKSASLGSSSLKTDPGVGLKLQVSGASVSLKGDWHYREDHWPHISDSGSFDLSTSGITISIAVKLGADPKGHPTIAAAGCSSSVDKVDIDLHGGASWLYNLFDSKIEDAIKSSLQGQLCSEVNDAINDQAAKALASFPVQKAIDKYSMIDYSLVSSPTFTTDYLDVFLKGEFKSISDPSEAPFSPSPLPPDSASSQMAYAYVTDYVINTAGLVYQKCGRLNTTITASDLPPNFSYPLNTKTFKLIIPKLYELYPDLPMQLVVYATEAPTLSSDVSGANVTIIGHLDSFVVLKNGSLAYTFTLGLKISGAATVAVKGGNITFHASFVSVHADLVRSAIGDITIDIKLLQFLLNAFVDKVIMTEINKYGDTGFPLPVIDGVGLTNTHVSSGKHFTLIATDIQYNPSSNVLARERLNNNAGRKLITIV